MFVQSKVHIFGVSGLYRNKELALANTEPCTGASQEIVGNPLDVARTYESTLPYISDITATSGGSPEQRLWTERLLTRFCMLTGHDSLLMADKLDSTSAPTVTLAPFRAWARFWEGRPGQGLSTLDSADINENLRRRHVWQAYYDIISKMLQSGSPYPLVTSNREIPNGTSSAAQYEMAKNPRLQQSTELRRVEATYEGLLLKEVQFPEADRANTEVDHWVDQVMANWRVICGPMWRDEDLGQGGQESAARNVLDVSVDSFTSLQSSFINSFRGVSAQAKEADIRFSIEQQPRHFIQRQFCGICLLYMPH